MELVIGMREGFHNINEVITKGSWCLLPNIGTIFFEYKIKYYFTYICVYIYIYLLIYLCVCVNLMAIGVQCVEKEQSVGFSLAYPDI